MFRRMKSRIFDAAPKQRPRLSTNFLRRTRNFIGVPNKPTGSTGASDFPQRFLYPQSELDANENIPSPLPEFFAPTAVLSSY